MKDTSNICCFVTGDEQGSGKSMEFRPLPLALVSCTRPYGVLATGVVLSKAVGWHEEVCVQLKCYGRGLCFIQ